MVRLSKVKEWWNNEEFIKDATQLVIEMIEKEMDKDIPETLTWVANSYPEDEQGLIAVYLFGQIGMGGILMDLYTSERLSDEGEKKSGDDREKDKERKGTKEKGKRAKGESESYTD